MLDKGQKLWLFTGGSYPTFPVPPTIHKIADEEAQTKPLFSSTSHLQ